MDNHSVNWERRILLEESVTKMRRLRMTTPKSGQFWERAMVLPEGVSVRFLPALTATADKLFH